MILRADHYDRDGRLFKRLTVLEVEREAGKYRWREVRMNTFFGRFRDNDRVRVRISYAF